MVYTVQISLSLATTLQAFNASVQQTFKEQMALAAGLLKSDSDKVTLSFPARRLLADLAVNVVIAVADKAAGDKVAGSLTEANINSRLTAVGLPSAKVTSPATVVANPVSLTQTTTPKPSAAPPSAPGVPLTLLAAVLFAAVRA